MFSPSLCVQRTDLHTAGGKIIMKGEVRRVSTLQSLASRNIDNTELNLRILQRHNPDASRIIAVGNHISLFLYHQEAWTKSDMEGCIFFYTKM